MTTDPMLSVHNKWWLLLFLVDNSLNVPLRVEPVLIFLLWLKFIENLIDFRYNYTWNNIRISKKVNAIMLINICND